MIQLNQYAGGMGLRNALIVGPCFECASYNSQRQLFETMLLPDTFEAFVHCSIF